MNSFLNLKSFLPIKYLKFIKMFKKGWLQKIVKELIKR